MNDAGDRPILDYRPPRRRVRRDWPWKWFIPTVFGSGAGFVLSDLGAGVIFAAPVFAFIVAFASAAFAPKRKLPFGMLGCGIMAVVCCLVAAIRNWKSGDPMALQDLPLMLLVLSGIVAIPGLLGVGVVHAATRPPNR